MQDRRVCLIVGLTLVAVAFSLTTSAQAPKGNLLFIENIEASVNDEIILGGELDQKMLFIPNVNAMSDAEYKKTRRMVLDRMIEDILIFQAGVAEKLELDPVELDRRVEEKIQSEKKNPVYESHGGFDAVMKKAGRSIEKMRENLRKNIQREYVISQAVYRRVDANVEVTDADVAKFKEESPEDFRKNQRVRIRQIILQVPKDATPEQEEETRVRANDILLRIKAGAPFVDMMEKYSEHEASMKDSGVLEYSRGELSPAFDRAFDMNPGEVSEVFRTPLGFHILRVESKQDIRDYLLYIRKRQVKDEWVSRLREKARVMVKGEKSE